MAEKMLENLKLVSEIASMPWSADIGEKTFTVIARVDGIYHEPGWFYATCSQCSKLLDLYNGFFWCDICDGVSRYPMLRYRVHLRVEDGSGYTILTMYNQQTEKLIDSAANKLFNRMDVAKGGVPVEICALAGRTFTFSIKVADYTNPDNDFHNHRVVRLSEIDPVPLPSFPMPPSKKVKRKKNKQVGCGVDNDAMSSSGPGTCGREKPTSAGDGVGGQ